MPAYYDKEKKTWEVIFYYTDWTGKKKQKHKRGFRLKREAEEFEREFLLKNSGDPQMTFKSLAELYFADAGSRVRITTVQTKRSIFDKHIMPYFENKNISEITKSDIREWQNELLKLKNPKNGKPYSPTYLRSINSQLIAIFQYAVDYHSLQSNPCNSVKPIGKKKAPTMQFWTLDQFNKFISQETWRIYHLAFLILYWTGMRCGELLALTPSSIIHEKKAFRIEGTFKRENDEYVIGDPKTDNSYRVVTMPEFLYNELMGYINSVYEIAADERIFYMTASGLRKEMQRMAKAAGVNCIRIHDLRHSHVALLIELRYNTHAIAERIGDTTTEVERTYAHLYPTAACDLAAELNRHRNGIEKSKEHT